MKADELKPCGLCNKGVMHSGAPVFYHIKVEVHGIDVKAVQRHAGLEQVFGGGQAGAKLAQVMGPNDNLTKKINTTETPVCLNCAVNPDTALARLLG